MDLTSISKYFIFIGAVFILIGAILFFMSKLEFGIGKLPGDILIQKGNTTFYFPLASSVLISIILTIVLNLIQKK